MSGRMKSAIHNRIHSNLAGELPGGKQESSQIGDHPMKKTLIRILSFSMAFLATLFLCQPASSWAQTTSASLSGVVADTTGALIPQASVILRNTKSHETRHAASNSAGIFRFNAVPAGTYSVTISMKGFQTLVTRDIELHPNDNVSMSELHMKVGAQEESVTVEANTDIATSGERSSLITAKDIQKLSTVGRDVSELLRTQAGFAVVQSGLDNASSSSAEVAGTYSGLSNYVGNGATANGASIISDGANVTDPGSGAGQTQTVNMDFVQEVKIETSNFGADTAKGPTVITAVGKSGGQAFHGNLRVYARTYQLNAQDWFQKFQNFGAIKDHYIYPGVEVGGPVLIPHTNFNKNRKLTFEFGAEDYVQRNVYAYGSLPKSLLEGLVPTKAMLNGNFSQKALADYLGVDTTDIDGTSGRYGAGCTPNGLLSTYYHICAQPQGAITIDPGVSAILRAYYEPGCTGDLSTCPGPGPTKNFYNTQTLNLENPDSYQIRYRLDYSINDTNKLFFVYNGQFGTTSHIPESIYYSPGTSGQAYLGGADTPGKINATAGSNLASVNYTHIFNSQMTNEIYAGLSEVKNTYASGNQSLLTKSHWGYPYQGIYPTATNQLPQVATYSAGDAILPFAITPDFSSGPYLSTKFLPSGGDNFSYVFRNHTFKLGIYVERDTANQTDLSPLTNGQISNYYMNNSSIGGCNNAFKGCGENYLADFFAGYVGTFTQQNFNAKTDLDYWTASWYATDSYKLTKRLTLDFGVRFDHLGPWQDKHGLGMATFFPNLYATDPKNTTNPDGSLFEPGVRWHGGNHATNNNAGFAGVPNSGVPSRWAFVSPRAGFAFDAWGNGTTILRGGWGMYRAHDSWNDFTGPAATAQGLVTSTAGGSPTQGSVALSQIGQIGPGFRCDFSQQNGCPSIMLLDPGDNQQPLTQTYSFSVSQRFPFDSVFDIAYVGNQSSNLLTDNASTNVVQSQDLRDINAIPIGSFFKPDPNPASTAFGQIPNLSSFQQTQQNDYRKYPNYSHMGMPRHIAYANYNALQTNWNKQRGRLNYGLNYTFSKALGIRGAFNNGVAGDPTNLRANYGPLAFDRTSIIGASYSYDVGERFHSGNRLLRGLGNFWLVSGITNWQSGPNLQAVYYPNFNLQGYANSSYGGNRCALGVDSNTATACQINNTLLLGTTDVMLQPVLRASSGCPGGDPTGGLQKNQYINGNCFALGPQGVNGPTNLGYIHGPAFFNSDLTLQKTIPLKESRNLQFRLAGFNFLNHPLTSFSSRYPREANLQFYDPNNVGFSGVQLVNNFNPNGSCSDAGSQCFGYAGFKTGRRVLEVMARYNF
jgi:hypothetical protein